MSVVSGVAEGEEEKEEEEMEEESPAVAATDAERISVAESARRAEEDAASVGMGAGSSSGVSWDALAERLTSEDADPYETFMFVCHALNHARHRVEAARAMLRDAEAADAVDLSSVDEELTSEYLSAFSDVLAASTARLELDVCLRRGA